MPSDASPRPSGRKDGNRRKPAARAFDTLIAAVAVSQQLSVYTCNPDDFAGIDELVVHPVPHPDHPNL